MASPAEKAWKTGCRASAGASVRVTPSDPSSAAAAGLVERNRAAEHVGSNDAVNSGTGSHQQSAALLQVLGQQLPAAPLETAGRKQQDGGVPRQPRRIPCAQPSGAHTSNLVGRSLWSGGGQRVLHVEGFARDVA